MGRELLRFDVLPTFGSLATTFETADPDGFFLMVEASQVDWACHANDPAHLLSDLLMYDEVVRLALDFAERHGETLVLALSDHNTGGMSIGNYATSKTYAHTELDQLLDPLRKMKLSAFGMWAKVGNEKTPEKVKSVVETYWRITISDEEAGRILQRAAEFGGTEAHNAFGGVLCPAHTSIGWTTHGHTGGDVPLFAFGPGRPVGLLDGQTAELPANKNLLKLADRTVEPEGVVVCVRDEQISTAYLPLEAVNVITGTGAELPAVARP